MMDADARTNLVRAGYDVIAEKYHAGRVAREAVNVAWLDTLRPMLPQQGKVVDLGCGGGVPITRYFADHGYEVVGLDLSPAMVALARQSVPNATFLAGSMLDAAFEADSLDLVASFFAIIHLDRALHPEMFRRIFGWLRPGGAALLSLGFGDNPDDRQEGWYGVSMAWSHFDAETNLDLLRQAGFTIAWSEIEHMTAESHLFVIATKPV